MELKPAKRKKFSAPSNSVLFPPANGKKFVSYFNGVSCIVKDENDMKDLFTMGFFGKGSLSRSEPVFNDREHPDIIFEQQYLNRKRQFEDDKSEVPCCATIEDQKLNLALNSIKTLFNDISNDEMCSNWKDWKSSIIKENSDNIITVAKGPTWKIDDSDDCHVSSNYLTELVQDIIKEGHPRLMVKEGTSQVVVFGGVNGPVFQTSVPAPKETLALNLQEAFFLAWALEKLTIFDKSGDEMTCDNMWQTFQAEELFVERYVIYHWYRSRGWVVRCGLKYGADFALYEKGPSFCHSSYLIRVHNDQKPLSWDNAAQLHRLAETIKKDIIYCSAIAPEGLKSDDLLDPDVVRRFRVREVMCRRWIPSLQRTKT